MNILEEKPINIKDLLGNNQYVIPIYQRNFAWKKEQILQLLNDIWNISDDSQHYYVGSLVVNERKDRKFEVIDGQQRLTAFNIINAVLRKKCCTEEKSCTEEKRNLFFEAREKSEQVLDKLLGMEPIPQFDDSYETTNILAAAKSVENFILEKETEKKGNVDVIKRICKNFYEKTYVFISKLPEGTNLNHYFEIMNNRGEQLEPHEILKARLLDKIDPEQQEAYASIWDACSQMNCYVLSLFDDTECAYLLDEKNGVFSVKKDLSYKTIDSQADKKKENSFLFDDICTNHNLPDKFSQEKKNQRTVRFGSIIDFPNFLLIALKTFLKNDHISLDGDKLMKEFENVLGDKYAIKNEEGGRNFDSAEFIRSLFHYRMLFDNYVIKREYTEDNWEWCIKKCTKSGEDWLYENSISNDDIRRKMRMLQSMLQVNNIQNSHKEWLAKLLEKINDCDDLKIVYDSLYDYAKEQFLKIVNDDDWCKKGLNTPRYVFNYTDYQLWLYYYDEVRGKNTIDNDVIGSKIANYKSAFSTFKFTYRDSREHLYPRNRFDEFTTEDDKEFAMNSFGNLCLVSSSSNSSWGDAMPIQKKHDAQKNGTNESLKLLVMFASFDDNNWGIDEIKQHGEQMIEFLKGTFPDESKKAE